MNEKYEYYPIILGIKEGLYYKFWCPFCLKWHLHGNGSGDYNAEGHRASHCTNPKSPLKDGYYIVERPWLKKWEMAARK